MDTSRLVSHSTQGRQTLDSGKHDSRFKGENHKERKGTVLPIVIEHPENDTKELKDGKGTQQLCLV